MLWELTVVALRSVCAYVLLLLLGRLTGRKMLSRITFFDFIVGITFGSLATHIALGSDETLAAGVTAALVITLLTLATDCLNVKSLRFRKLEEGEPVVLIRNGQILDLNLKRVRISLEKLTMLLRQKNIFDLGDVNYAVLESDGQLSTLLKPPKQPATAGDLKLAGSAAAPACDLIVDGKLRYAELKKRNLDERWVLDQLAKQNVREIRDVFYAGIQPSGGFYVSVRTRAKE